MGSLLILLLSQPALVGCACLCIDGLEKVTCPSIEQALHSHRLCADVQCGVDAPHQPIPAWLDTPSNASGECYEVRVTDDLESADRRFRSVRVCEQLLG